MRSRNRALLVMFGLVFGATLHLTYCASQLPQSIRASFELGTAAHAWIDRQTFVLLYAALVAIMVLASLGFRRFLNRIPWLMFSLPNKDYWMSPQQRRSSLSYVVKWVLWANNATLLMIIGLMHVTFMANRMSYPRFDRAMLSTILWGYLLLAVLWLLVLHQRFRKPA